MVGRRQSTIKGTRDLNSHCIVAGACCSRNVDGEGAEGADRRRQQMAVDPNGSSVVYALEYEARDRLQRLHSECGAVPVAWSVRAA